MVIVKVWGGLGNQLFQYAFGQYLSQKLHTGAKYDVQVKLNIKNFTAREFGLSSFNTNVDLAAAAEIQNLRYQGSLTLERINRKLAQKFPGLYKHYRIEPVTHQKESLLQAMDDCYYDGYWQSYKFLEPIEQVLRKEITLRHPLNPAAQKTESAIELSSSAGVHIRRSDYLGLQHMNICHLSYYENAIQYLESKITGIKFFIFTDDAEWCRAHFKEPKFIVVEGNQPHEDLILLSKCKHTIIANSSFSWWAAWLNDHGGKTVIAPDRWHNRDNNNYNDIVPEHWIKINVG